MKSFRLFLLSLLLLVPLPQALLAQGMAGNPLAVLMGDSITQGWASRDGEWLEAQGFVGRGISGQTTPQMLARFRSDVIDLHPSYVVILAGINDIAGNSGYIEVEQIFRNIVSMCEQAAVSGIRPVVCSLTPANAIGWRKDLGDPTPKILALNGLLERYAQEKGYPFVDYYTPMVGKDGELLAAYARDAVHPSLEGYRKMEEILLSSVAFDGLSSLPETLEGETLVSPDGKLSMTFALSGKGEPLYQLRHGDTPVILPSRLGFTLLGVYKGSEPEDSDSRKRYGEDGDLREGFTLLRTSRDSKDETWETVWGEESHIRNHYNELAVTLSRPGMAPVHKKRDRARSLSQGNTFTAVVTIRFRLYDDGLGFRYEFPEEGDLTYFTIKEERTQFRMAGDPIAWWIPGDVDTQEYTYAESRLSEIPARMATAVDYSDDRLFSPTGVQTALQMRTDEGLYVNIHEAAVVNYPAMHLEYDPASNAFTSWLCPDAAGRKGRLQAPCVTPWRSVMVCERATDVLASRLTLNLNEPCVLEDVSWIHPTKYVGVWWEMITGKSTWAYTWDYPAVRLGETDYSKAKPNGKHGATNENVRRYIDFAADNGFDGVLVEGWNEGWEDWHGCEKEAVFDFVTPYPDFDLPALNAYAHSKGIRLIMHHETSSSTLNYERHLEAAFDLMNRYGYDAVKTGYVGNILPIGEGHYSQGAVNHYNYVLEQAARHHIMINAHEAVRPTGLCRTWPNLIGNESAQGNEYRGRVQPHQVTVLPFTRLMGGPMDYTPGIFETDISRLNPASKDYMKTTLCKQLALYVTLYSPLQMAADLPEYYAEHMDAFQFIRDVAVDWEQSRYLAAEPGDYIVIARQVRKGSLDAASKGVARLRGGKRHYVNGASRFAAGNKDVWFIGGVTDENAREVSFPLDFLKSGARYAATIYRDAPDADGVSGLLPDGSNPSKRYVIEQREVTAGDSLTLWMARSGGFAVSLKEK